MNKKRTISGEDNVFEEFQTLINKTILKEKKENINLYELQETLFKIENTLEKTLFKTDSFWETFFYRKLDTSLRQFLSAFIIRGFNNDILYHSFIIFSKYLHFLSKESLSVKSDNEIAKNFQLILPSSFFSLDVNPHLEFEIKSPEDYYSINDFEESLGKKLNITKTKKQVIRISNFETFKVFCDDYKVQEIRWDNYASEFKIMNSLYYLNISLIYEPNNTEIKYPELFALSFLNITTALKSINDIRVEISDIQKGSIYVKIRLWMKDIFTKEEAKNLLKKGKEAVVNEYVDKKIISIQKLKKEVSKIDIEEKILKSQLDEKLSIEQIKEKIKYDIELQKLEVERKKLELIDMKMKLVNESHNLMKNGIISANQLDFFVNEHLYLKKEDDSILDSNIDLDDIT